MRGVLGLQHVGRVLERLLIERSVVVLSGRGKDPLSSG
jgi:hypothetical protein